MKKLLITFVAAVFALAAQAQLVPSGVTVVNSQGRTLNVYNLEAIDKDTVVFVVQATTGGQDVPMAINCRSFRDASSVTEGWRQGLEQVEIEGVHTAKSCAP